MKMNKYVHSIFRYLLLLLLIIAFLSILESIFLFLPYPAFPPKPAWVVHDLSFSTESDARWLSAMRHLPVQLSVRFSPPDASSLKFLLLLSDGSVVLAKPLACPLHRLSSFFSPPLPPSAAPSPSLLHDASLCQGWPDIVGFHLDRLLRLRRKPPALGRPLTNRQLYSGSPLLSGDPLDALHWLLWWLPAYRVDCLLQPWLPGLSEGTAVWAQLQSKPLIRFLTHPERSPPPSSPLFPLSPPLPFQKLLVASLSRALHPTQAYLALDVSDTMLFDYLLDDHDRQAEKNWVLIERFSSSSSTTLSPCDRLRGSWSLPCPQTIVLWDSGMGFRHGPLSLSDSEAEGARDCLTVLRGANVARNLVTANDTQQHVCRFRKSTLLSLLALSEESEAGPSSWLFSRALAKRLAEDPLYPQFAYGIYREPEWWWWRSVRFESAAFYLGLEQRLTALLAHVARCIERYSLDSVVISDDELYLQMRQIEHDAALFVEQHHQFDDWTWDELRRIEKTMKLRPKIPDQDSD